MVGGPFFPGGWCTICSFQRDGLPYYLRLGQVVDMKFASLEASLDGG